ncbi:uncharacterized protein LOC135337940 isoform X3 [Halichondria panicea]|uniref:uncharacterized protein LOC135337940 isoform X3 n=1 Tax=Halichondria panicea TaxID=6063 RepID=UPI00312B34ED
MALKDPEKVPGDCEYSDIALLPPDSERVLQEGLFLGQLPNMTDWTTYYLQVTTTHLHILDKYNRQNIRSLKLDLSSNLVWEDAKNKEDLHFFVLRFGDGKYTFRCDSLEDKSSWVSQLQSIIHRKEVKGGTDTVEASSSYDVTDYEECKWFWGKASRQEAERRLLSEGKVGNFIVRINASGHYVMTYWREDGIHHHKILNHGTIFRFEKSSFKLEGESLIDLLDAYMMKRSSLMEPFGGALFGMHNYAWTPPSFDMHLLEERLKEHKRLQEKAARAGPLPHQNDLLHKSNSSREDSWSSSTELSTKTSTNTLPKPWKKPLTEDRYGLINLIQTEKDYLRSLERLINGYLKEMQSPNLPDLLKGNEKSIFGNIQKVYEFSKMFLGLLEESSGSVEKTASCFIEQAYQLEPVYTAYCANVPRSRSTINNYQRSGGTFFLEVQTKLREPSDIYSILLMPMERFLSYSDILSTMQKGAKTAQLDTPILTKAHLLMVDISKRANNTLNTICGYEGTIHSEQLIEHMQNVWLRENSVETQKVGVADYPIDPLGFALGTGSVESQESFYVLMATSAEKKEQWVQSIKGILKKQSELLKEGKAEEEEYLKKLDKLMTSKEKINLQYLKMYFIGPSGLGKTTTRKRLMGLFTNLESLPEEKRERCSTYLAECTQVLAVVGDSPLNLFLKISETLDEEAQLIFLYLYGSKVSELAKKPATKEHHNPSPSAQLNKTPVPPNPRAQTTPIDTKVEQMEARTEIISKKEEVQEEVVEEEEEEGEVKEKEFQILTVDVDQVISRLRSIVGSGKYVEQLLGKVLINIVDIGGQPGFIEMFPFLSKGPGIFLAFFPLDKDLDDPCEVSYERDGEKITPYKSSYTIRQTVSQILSAINHYDTVDSDINQELSLKIGKLGLAKPVASLIGTFKDKLETQVKTEILFEKLATENVRTDKSVIEEAIKHALNEDPQTEDATSSLQKAVKEHLVSDSENFREEVKQRLEQKLREKNEALGTIACNFEHLLSAPADEQHFIAVDNFAGLDDDINPLREHLQDMFQSFFSEAKLPIHPSQLLLGVVLRKEYDIVSMEDCIRIGQALNMSEEDVRFTVWYLDRYVGALIYNPNIKDKWFKGYVICSPQIVFDSISILVVESLLEVHSQSKSLRRIRFTKAERRNWTEKGQFSMGTIERCHSEESKKKVQEGKLIPVDKLLKLLEHSHLLAPITVRKPGSEVVETLYFIPAILECASPEELQTPTPADIDTPSPIKITFEPRYVPIGLFCAMISELVSRGNNGILGMTWRLIESRVKRNLVSFHVDSVVHQVTLVAHVDCIEIQVARKDRSIDLSNLCSYALLAVLFVMKLISSLSCHIIAFDCQCGRHGTKNADKLCRLSPGVSTCFTCEHGRVSLTASQEHWFATEVHLGQSISLRALPYGEPDPNLEFKWSKNGSLKAEENELKMEKVSPDDCAGYYNCKILRNGKDFFSVHHCLKLAGGDSANSADVTHTSSKDCLSVDSHLQVVRHAVWEVRSDWFDLGVELDISHGTLMEIKADHKEVNQCFTAMLQCWLSQTSPPPTWATLIEALNSTVIGRQDIANNIGPDLRGHFESTDKSSVDQQLGVDDLKQIRSATFALKVHWFDLGVELDVTLAKLQEIKNDHHDTRGRFTALLIHWLERKTPLPTWSALLTAVRSPPVDHNDLADDIEAMLSDNNI